MKEDMIKEGIFDASDRATIMPKCKHPKELRDKCDGKLYCIGCNEDLE